MKWKKIIQMVLGRNKILMVLGGQLGVEVERWQVIETEIEMDQVDTDPVEEDLMNGTLAREVIVTMGEEGGIVSGEPFMEVMGT